MPQIKTGLLRSPQSPISSPLDMLHRFQAGPKLARPNMVESFIPVIGPAWEAVADLQDGNYAGAAFNGGMAVLDALPVGVAVKGVRAATKGVKVLKEGSLTANAAQRQYRNLLQLKGTGQEVHHTVPLNGIKRNVPDWRNHYAFLKPLPQAQHRRLTGRWGDLPEYNQVQKLWYGTTDWMKAAPAGVVSSAADTLENVSRQREQRRRSPRRAANRQWAVGKRWVGSNEV